jgi:glutathione S-transferase
MRWSRPWAKAWTWQGYSQSALAKHNEFIINSGHEFQAGTPVTLPILYSFRRCPYAMRARLALFASGTACELREVKLSAKPDALRAASVKATVPVLVLPGGEVIDQSLDIMRWCLGERDPDDWLGRDDPALIAINDGQFKRDLDGYKYPGRGPGDAGAHRDTGLAFLSQLDARLAGSAQLCGNVAGIADMAIMPFVRQFAAVDREWFDAQPLPRLKAWLAGHLDSALFTAVMVRYSPWQVGDAPVLFG